MLLVLFVGLLFFIEAVSMFNKLDDESCEYKVTLYFIADIFLTLVLVGVDITDAKKRLYDGVSFVPV